MDGGGRGTEGQAIGLGVKKCVSFGHNAPGVGNVVTGIPAAVAQELHQDGQLCNLPAPSDDDIAKMQWMGDVEIEADSDDDRADDDAIEGAMDVDAALDSSGTEADIVGPVDSATDSPAAIDGGGGQAVGLRAPGLGVGGGDGDQT